MLRSLCWPSAVGSFVCVLGVGVVSSAPLPAAAQIFVTDSLGNKITTYHFDGSIANPTLVAGLQAPYGLAISGTDLFVVNSSNNTLGMYTTAGAVQKASLIANLGGPQVVSVSGNSLFVSTQFSTRISLYFLSGTTASLGNASLATGFDYITGIGVSGSNLFVLDAGNNVADGSGSVAMYTISGTTATLVNGALITGLNVPSGMAVHGSDLYITDFYDGASSSGSIQKFTVSGSTATGGLLVGGSLVNFPNAIAVTDDASTLFITNSGPGPADGGSIGEFTSSGDTVNAALVTGLSSNLLGIAVAGNAAPTVSITQWRSVRNHVLNVPQRSIVLNPTAIGNGLAGPTVECRYNGIQRIDVDFSAPVTIADANAITVVGRTTNYPSGNVMGSPVSYTPQSISMTGLSSTLGS